MIYQRVCELVAGLALSCVVTSVAAQEVLVTPDEIQKTWVDKKIFSRSPTGGLVDFYIRSDSSAEVSGNGWSDTGTWRLSGTGYCTTWKRIRAGEERCFTAVKNGSTVTVLNPDKSVSAEILKVGN